MTKFSGRRSAADMNAARLEPQVEPPRKLLAPERRVWDRVLGAWPPGHFIASDADMLLHYCVWVVLFEKAANEDDDAVMNRASGKMLACARALRITKQSQYDEKEAATRAKAGKANAPAAEALIGGNEWPETPQPVDLN